ncbi:hypothetical protein U1Q18_018587 [Sarracenia purpurea var. burkii]
MKELPVSGCVMKGATLLGVVSDHPMLRSVVVSDGSKQGRLSMRTGQVEDLRSNLTSAAQLNSSPSPDRTPVPALKMKLWHVPVLELPVSGCVMKGATLLGVVSDHPMLRSVVVSDGSKQGRLSMRTEQVEDLRSNLTSAAQLESSPSPDRTPVPALKMKLWHVPVLELPVSGCVMKGATLLVIRPVHGANVAERDGDLVGRVWDGEEEVEEAETMMFGEAAGEMMKNKKTYTLEMNSF